MKQETIKVLIGIFGLALFLAILVVVYQEQRSFADADKSYVDEIFPH